MVKACKSSKCLIQSQVQNWHFWLMFASIFGWSWSHWDRVFGSILGLLLADPRFQRGARQRSSKKGRKVEKLSVVMEDEAGECVEHDDCDSMSSCSDMDIVNDVQPEAIEADEEIRLHIMGLSSYFTSVVETNWASKISQLPTRYLPPGSIRLLYFQFCVRDGSRCSYLHFWRTYREVWHNVLRFQAPSTHGQCDECANYKESFGKTGGEGDQHRFEIARAYKEHVTAVGRDRELENFLQAQRPLEQGSCLAIHWEPWDLSWVWFGCLLRQVIFDTCNV